MDKSPFYKESHHEKYKRGKEQPKPSFRIPESAYNDLMRYFKANGMNETDGFRQLVWDKLESINTFRERRCFNQIEFIMLIPRNADIISMTENSRIIALYNTESDFIKKFNHQNGFKKDFNYHYDLNYFNEGFFRKEMQIINSTKESKVFRVNKNDLREWDRFYSRLEKLIEEDEEWDLNLADCYFVRCPLNNYLDVKREGQFQSSVYRGDHEGIYVFYDSWKKRFYCHIYWNYDLESRSIAFKVYFITMEEFMMTLKDADFRPLRESYGDLEHSEYEKKRLDSFIKGQEEILDFLRSERDKL